jgi:hypothetical protein
MKTRSRMTFPLIALGITLVVIAAVVLIGAQSVSADNEVSPQIEGTWLATITTPDGMQFPSLVTYAGGGALTVTDGGGPPPLGNVYQGAWAKTGPHAYVFTFLGFQYDDTGALAGYIRGHETLQIEPGGDVYNGETTIEILDTDQNVIVTLTTTSHATRITAQ